MIDEPSEVHWMRADERRLSVWVGLCMFAVALVLLAAAVSLTGCASLPVTATQVAQIKAAWPKIVAAAPPRWWDPGFGRAEPWTCDQAQQRLWLTHQLHEPSWMVRHVRRQEQAVACGADMTRAR